MAYPHEESHEIAGPTTYLPASTGFLVIVGVLALLGAALFAMDSGFFYHHRSLEGGPSLSNVKLSYPMHRSY